LSGSQLTCWDTTATTRVPQVADRGTPSIMDKRVALDKEGAADKHCLGEGKL